MKDGAYATNLDNENRKGTHWVSLFVNKDTALYLHSFWIEYIPQEVLNKIKDESITHNILQDYQSIMCGFYCTAFIEYMLSGKTFLDHTNLSFPNDYRKTDKILYLYFKDKYGRRSKLRL